VRSADDAAVAADETGTLLALPLPFVTPSGATSGEYGDLFGWDTYFINIGMLELGLLDQARGHIVNQLSLVERYGKVLNGNRSYYTTRGQPPLLAESVIRYARRRDDPELLELAYPLLVREYEDWWCGERHATPTGLATNWDAGDPHWVPTLAAEAETGLDFTPIFDGDVRRCVPLLTNSVLIAYADALAWIASRVGTSAQAAAWRNEAAARAERVRRRCWSSERSCFVEYDFVRATQLPYLSACTLWPLWAGAATTEQAAGAVRALARLEHEHGLATTDRIYESPHPQYPGWLQWEFPAGWAPLHIVAVEALDRCGYAADAARIATKFLRLMLACYESTGQLWEKYDVVTGGIELPAAEHAANQEMHGWTAAAVVLLGRRVFGG
jgi:alpha,alpha-trehalase